MRHVAPGGVRHLAILQVEARLWEEIEIADVVVVQMGDDDVLHRCRIHAEQPQAFRRRAQELDVCDEWPPPD